MQIMIMNWRVVQIDAANEKTLHFVRFRARVLITAIPSKKRHCRLYAYNEATIVYLEIEFF